jgi:chemotaxis protein CheY-P-specific phosphatase CheC
MTKAMFIDICHSVARRKGYFQRTENAAGVLCFTTIQKVAAAVHMLAYGGPADHLNEYIRMGESIILECVNKITRTIVQEYGDIYLREPNEQDIARLLEVAE